MVWILILKSYILYFLLFINFAVINETGDESVCCTRTLSRCLAATSCEATLICYMYLQSKERTLRCSQVWSSIIHLPQFGPLSHGSLPSEMNLMHLFTPTASHPNLAVSSRRWCAITAWEIISRSNALAFFSLQTASLLASHSCRGAGVNDVSEITLWCFRCLLPETEQMIFREHGSSLGQLLMLDQEESSTCCVLILAGIAGGQTSRWDTRWWMF